jgi:dienelactone hydrolase
MALLLPGQTVDPRQKLIDYLDSIAHTQLEGRPNAIARIQTRADAEQRRETVRRKVIELIGGLPESTGPVAVKSFGAISGDGFRIEKLAFESLSGFWVTANVYVPTGRDGPFPGVVLTPGHEASGKTGQYSWGVNFARIGMVALAIDPIGQGERLQYYDAGKKASIVGGATAEHGMANLSTMLVGDDLMRYMVHDGMRAIDYLSARKDVDAAHIGALGCSGGGTATAVLAALDDRVQAAGTACYITSFEELLPSATGVQEAEQSIPHFIEAGLDFADWVEAAAPRPYAIISTTADMFPFEGARQSYSEAKRFYALYGAEDRGAENRLQWITGPGGHGNLGPISPAILSFFAKYLKGDATEQQFIPARPANADDLRCTPTGYIDGETVWSLNRQRIATPPAEDVAHLRADVRTLAGILWQPRGKAPALPEGVKIFRPEGNGPAPAVLWIDAAEATETPEIERLVKGGSLIAVMAAQPWPQGTESVKSPYLGSFNLLSLRAFLVGKTIVGIRADDALEAADWLFANEQSASLTIHAAGALGIVALHAAVLDTRISRVEVDDSLPTYRSMVDEPLHRNASELVIPGVLKKYDVPDLVRAIAPRQVRIVRTVQGDGAPK